MTESTAITHGVDISAMDRDSRQLNLQDEKICLEVKDLNLYYGEKQALKNINMTIPKQRVSSFIGPSGCGKSTLLRCFNRMNDLVDGARIEGKIEIDGEAGREFRFIPHGTWVDRSLEGVL